MIVTMCPTCPVGRNHSVLASGKPIVGTFAAGGGDTQTWKAGYSEEPRDTHALLLGGMNSADPVLPPRAGGAQRLIL
jgi:hypothetical protein